jgi:hypothetical protein
MHMRCVLQTLRAFRLGETAIFVRDSQAIESWSCKCQTLTALTALKESAVATEADMQTANLVVLFIVLMK